MQACGRQFPKRCAALAGACAMLAVTACMRENVCYEPQRMPEFGQILRAVPCDEAKRAPED
ncbi:MAG: hypothetical protein BroJett029_37540 [Alphaproteobacteria bacterium]|nr:MAG: hypothetical protein BroJett029_37540 [Alphaproteobacteria bacterium]